MITPGFASSQLFALTRSRVWTVFPNCPCRTSRRPAPLRPDQIGSFSETTPAELRCAPRWGTLGPDWEKHARPNYQNLSFVIFFSDLIVHRNKVSETPILKDGAHAIGGAHPIRMVSALAWFVSTPGSALINQDLPKVRTTAASTARHQATVALHHR